LDPQFRDPLPALDRPPRTLENGDHEIWEVVSWNLLFLGVVAIIPFPSSLLSEHHGQALSVFIFSATYAVAGAALAGMATACRGQDKLEGASSEESLVARAVTMLLAIALLSCLLALFRPWLGVLTWAVFPFASALGSRRSVGSPAADGS